MGCSASIIEDLPLFHLQRDDVILVEPDAKFPVSLYRVLPSGYATVLPVLVEQGVAVSSLSGAALAACVGALPEILGGSANPLPRARGDRRRHGQGDRRDRHLKIVGD